MFQNIPNEPFIRLAGYEIYNNENFGIKLTKGNVFDNFPSKNSIEVDFKAWLDQVICFALVTIQSKK